MARTDGEKQISPIASMVMAILIGAALAYLGLMLVSFGFYALGEDETFIGLGSLVLGGIFVVGVLAVVVSQVRAWSRSRR